MEKIDVSFYTKKQNLGEIYQPVGIQYAFLSPDNKQCHPWIKCRDFLHDALRCFITGKKEVIFGFSYEPGIDPPLDLEKMRLLVKRKSNRNEENASENTKTMIDSTISILRCIEKYSEIESLSNIFCTTKDEDIYIFEGAADWMESTFMISLYTLLIRIGCRNIIFEDKKDLDSKLEELCKLKEAYNDHDIGYLRTVLPFIYKILEKRKDLKYIKEDGNQFFEKQSIGLFHNYSGVVELSRMAKPENHRGNNEKLEELITLSKRIA